MVVLGLLAAISVLKYIDLSRTAYAAKSRVDSSPSGWRRTTTRRTTITSWPSDQEAGIVPPEMIPYLPNQFFFVTPTYELDWDNRSPSRNPFQLAIAGPTDARLMNSLRQTLGNRAPYFFSGNRLTYILVDSYGNW